jgi:hypothetical protein
MKTFILVIAILICICNESYAQLNEGETIIGTSLGINSSPGTPSLGFNIENQVTSFDNVATLGVGGLLRYSSFKDGPPYGFYDYSYFTLGAQTNVNFNNIGSGKFVPFVGAVLGYNFINSNYVSPNGIVYTTASRTSGLWLWGQAGFRYFFSPKFAGGLRLGSGNFNFNVFELAIDFKL